MKDSEVKQLNHGLYRVFWDTGGNSLASIGSTHDGTRWIAPCNWTFEEGSMNGACTTNFNQVDYVEEITVDEIEDVKRDQLKNKFALSLANTMIELATEKAIIESKEIDFTNIADVAYKVAEQMVDIYYDCRNTKPINQFMPHKHNDKEYYVIGGGRSMGKAILNESFKEQVIAFTESNPFVVPSVPPNKRYESLIEGEWHKPITLQDAKKVVFLAGDFEDYGYCEIIGAAQNLRGGFYLIDIIASNDDLEAIHRYNVVEIVDKQIRTFRTKPSPFEELILLKLNIIEK